MRVHVWLMVNVSSGWRLSEHCVSWDGPVPMTPRDRGVKCKRVGPTFSWDVKVDDDSLWTEQRGWRRGSSESAPCS